MKILLASLIATVSSICIIDNHDSENEPPVKSSYDNLEQALLNDSMVKVLDLSESQLTSLPSEVSELKKLKTLKLANNDLKQLNASLSQLTTLQEIDLSGNQNIQLKRVFRELSGVDLKELYLENCLLTFLPNDIKHFSNLEILDLSDNHLFELPYFLNQLTELKHVDLRSNNLEELGYSASLWRKLESIDLRDNDELNIRKAFHALQYIPTLQVIKLNNLSSLPENTKKLQTKELYLESCNLYKFPEGLKQNESISTLTLNNCNGIDSKTFFQEIAQMPSVKAVELNGSLDNLKVEEVKLTQLIELDLSNNNLEDIQLSRKNFPNLKSINLKGNQLSRDNLQQLQREFPNCQITSDLSLVNTTPKKIDPPIKELVLETTKYSVDANKSTVLEYEGSKINIPENAFLDKNGNVVKGKVDIEYREFHDPVDVMLSGIPMQYDSADMHTTLETAGMIEFRATVNGEEVFPNPDALINVDLNSRQTSDDYNVYSLDDSTGAWSFQEPSVIEEDNSPVLSDQALENVTGVDSAWAMARRIRMMKPILNTTNLYPSLEKNKANKVQVKMIYQYTFNTWGGRRQFATSNLSIHRLMNYGLYYEGDNYREDRKKIKRFYKASKKNQKLEDDTRSLTTSSLQEFGEYFEGYELKINKEYDCYDLIFHYSDTTLSIPVSIKLHAFNEYKEQKKNAKFWKKHAKDIQDEYDKNQKTIEAFNRAVAQYEDDLEEMQVNARDFYKQEILTSNVEANVTRTVTLTGFGYVNCDRPALMPNYFVRIEIEDQNGEAVIPYRSFVLNGYRNSVFTYPYKDIAYSKSTQNALVVIDREGRIGMMYGVDFNKQIGYKTSDVVKVNMDFEDASGITQKELKERLSF